jgi:NTP pyrophosphatase (non-canonical NTP hydrolase)
MEAHMLAGITEAMREKLAARRDHGDWREEQPSWLMAWLQTEVRELSQALRNLEAARAHDEHAKHLAECLSDVRAECADVANLAGMILDTIERAPMREGTEEEAK